MITVTGENYHDVLRQLPTPRRDFTVTVKIRQEDFGRGPILDYVVEFPADSYSIPVSFKTLKSAVNRVERFLEKTVAAIEKQRAER